MPKHIRRLILVLIGFGIVAITVRHFVVDRSFYEYGHYRGDAVAEMARAKAVIRPNTMRGHTAFTTAPRAARSSSARFVMDRVPGGIPGRTISTRRPVRSTPTT